MPCFVQSADTLQVAPGAYKSQVGLDGCGGERGGVKFVGGTAQDQHGLSPEFYGRSTTTPGGADHQSFVRVTDDAEGGRRGVTVRLRQTAPHRWYGERRINRRRG